MFVPLGHSANGARNLAHPVQFNPVFALLLLRERMMHRHVVATDVPVPHVFLLDVDLEIDFGWAGRMLNVKFFPLWIFVAKFESVVSHLAYNPHCPWENLQVGYNLGCQEVNKLANPTPKQFN